MVNSHNAVKEAGINIRIEIKPYGAKHPNTYKFTLGNSRERHEMTAISTGGGMIEVIYIDGFNLSMTGGYFETLIFIEDKANQLLKFLKQNIQADEILLHVKSTQKCIEIKAQSFLKEELILKIQNEYDVLRIKTISPVLPVLSNKNGVPFITCDAMLEYNRDKNLQTK